MDSVVSLRASVLRDHKQVGHGGTNGGTLEFQWTDVASSGF